VPDQSTPDLVRETPVQTAGYGRRFAAICIDWFACLAAARVLYSKAPYGSPESSLATLCVFALEVIIFTWLIQASFGQRIVGIMITRTDGSRLGLGRVVIRTVLLCLVIPVVIVDAQGRGLHDRAAGSIVIRRRAAV